MSGNDKEAQQKRTTGPRKNELSPLTFEMTDQDIPMSEDDLLAEDDPLAANPPRPSTSAIRLNNPTNLTGSRRAISTTTQQSQQTPRTSAAIPPRRNGQVIAPLPGSTTARPIRNVTTPQSPSEPDKQARNIHWLLYVGVGMVAALALWVVGSSLVAWGSAKYNDIAYGNPRTFQTDAVVGHGGDSPQHPSHFIALNLNGQVIIIELRAGNPANSINYTGPHFYETGGNLIAITLEFRDVNHDGKPDMLIHFQDNVIVFLNDGTQFIPPK
jgi:hypothetical protein